MMKNSKKYLITLTSFIFIAFSCKESKVTITNEYVINPNWSETNNWFSITKLELKESSDTINLKDVSQPELLKKLTKDKSFSYGANIKYNGVKYSKRKIYFNKNNGFTWRSNSDLSSGRVILGELEQDSWYLLDGLSNLRTQYYIYIDSLDNMHRFSVFPSNW